MKLLVVDDILLNRAILRELFCDHYDVLEAENGEVALRIIEEYGTDIAVVLLDIVMPVMDGFAVLNVMNNTGLINKVPVIFITGEDDDEKALRGYGMGVSDLVHKPFNPDILCRRVANVVDLYSYKNDLERRVTSQMKKLKAQSERIRESNLYLIDALSTTVEFHSSKSDEHIKRVRSFIKILIEKLKNEYDLNDEEIEIISNASALHDIGKIAIPDSVLLKPGALTKEEFEIIKAHAIRGCEMLDSVAAPMQDEKYMVYSYEICRHHHERWDGRGYPDKLKGNEIPIWAQAAGLADVYDVLTSKRVYKDAYPHEEAVKMIVNGECGAFNPQIVDVFLEVAGELNRTARSINNEAAQGKSMKRHKGE